MNQHTIHVLEFTRLLAEIAEFANSTPGRETLAALRPLPGLGPERVHHPGYGAIMRLIRDGGEPPSVAFESVEDSLKRVRPIGAILDIEDLTPIRDHLTAAGRTRDFLLGAGCRDYAALAALGARMHDPNELLRRFAAIFDEENAVRDSASPKLATIRREVAALERGIRRRLEQLLQLAGDAEVYQDEYIVLRNDRFVVPVRREFKSRIKGIIHDQSNSGRTLFIEPAETVEAGNERVRLRLDERDEIRRILGELSDRIRDHSGSFRDTHAALIDYDCWLAIGRWACLCNCNFPRVGKQFILKEARHPLLLTQFSRDGRSEQLVPLNLKLDLDCRVLAITGANTGGKTVILKTVGLLTLMVHAGLPIPAGEESMVPAFDSVLADIGDEQSLAHNLSTFSAHLRNIASILGEVPRRRSLVLLDELGSGTDPLEGGALGCAILDHLAEAGALTMTTTHLGLIKTWVHSKSDMINASVQFNRDTLQAEYVLRLGTPGASHALTIARKFSVPESVVQAAEALMGPEHQRLETILADIEQEQSRLQRELAEAKTARKKVKQEQAQLEHENLKLREERKRLINDAQTEAAAIVSNTRREMEQLLSSARSLAPDQREQARELRKNLETTHSSLKESLTQAAKKPATNAGGPIPAAGERVWVDKLNDHALLIKITGRQALVDFNGMQVNVPADGMHRTDHQPGKGTAKQAVNNVRKPAGAQAAIEVNLVGCRVEDALRELERAIDRGLLQGMTQLRVIHGFGTGVLRTAIHDYLRTAPGVDGFKLGTTAQDPGGQGATLIQLET